MYIKITFEHFPLKHFLKVNIVINLYLVAVIWLGFSTLNGTVLRKSKLPAVASRFLRDENHVARYAILVAHYENRVGRARII